MLNLQNDTQFDTGKRYPDETKELAYQLWAFMTGRNASAVCRLLQSGEYEVEDVPPYQAISYWAREYGWADRATSDVASIAPDLRHQAFSELLFAGLDGAKYIRRVNAGQEEPNKVRAMLAIAAVDRIGFSPVGSRDPSASIHAPSSAVAIPNFDTMTTDQLREYEHSIRRKRRAPTMRQST